MSNIELFKYSQFGYKSYDRYGDSYGRIFIIDFFNEETSKVKYILEENDYLTYKSEIEEEIDKSIEYFKERLDPLLEYSRRLQSDYLKIKNVMDLNLNDLEEINIDISIDIDIKEIEYNYMIFTNIITRISYFSILSVKDNEYYLQAKKDLNFMITIFKNYKKSHFENIEIENEVYIDLEKFGSGDESDSIFKRVVENYNVFLEDEDETL